MSKVKWIIPSTRTIISNSSWVSLLAGSESTVTQIDNTLNAYMYGEIMIQLSAATTFTNGSTVILRVNFGDGTDVADAGVGGDLYPVRLLGGASSSISVIPMVRLYPLIMRFSLINNTSSTLGSGTNTGNMRMYNEDIS